MKLLRVALAGVMIASSPIGSSAWAQQPAAQSEGVAAASPAVDDGQSNETPSQGAVEAQPGLSTPTGTVQVHAPQFGMNLDEVQRDGYRYTRRQWRDMVRNDPQLYRLHRRGRLVVPGAILTAIGGAWLLGSITLDMDNRRYTRHSSDVLTQYIYPLALIGAGVPMLIVGAQSRRELERRHFELMAAPVGLRQGGGVTLFGRF